MTDKQERDRQRNVSPVRCQWMFVQLGRAEEKDHQAIDGHGSKKMDNEIHQVIAEKMESMAVIVQGKSVIGDHSRRMDE